MTSYFIADIHLTTIRPMLTERFLTFCKQLQDGDHLYILGDLFDYYIGLDDNNEIHQRVHNLFHDLCTRNISIYFQHGNRDFLLTEKDALYLGFHLLNDIEELTIGQTKFVLVHGDELCKENFRYRFFRWFSRIHFLQKLFFLCTSKATREKIAKKMRANSQMRFKAHNYQKQKICLQLATQLMARKQANILIHGHTHNAEEIHQDNGVIFDTGDWSEERSSIVVVNEEGQATLQILNK